MESYEQFIKPSKTDQKLATESYRKLINILGCIQSDTVEIHILESNEKITLPVTAMKQFGEILKTMGEGKLSTIVKLHSKLTTQKAAEILNCSRPHVIKLLEEGKIHFTKVGKHRRILLEDLLAYKHQMKQEQRKHLMELMRMDEESGLYE